MATIMNHHFGVLAMISHYNNQIESVCNRSYYRRQMGVFTDADLEKSNEDLYKLFMYRNNLIEIAQKRYDEEDFQND